MLGTVWRGRSLKGKRNFFPAWIWLTGQLKSVCCPIPARVQACKQILMNWYAWINSWPSNIFFFTGTLITCKAHSKTKAVDFCWSRGHIQNLRNVYESVRRPVDIKEERTIHIAFITCSRVHLQEYLWVRFDQPRRSSFPRPSTLPSHSKITILMFIEPGKSSAVDASALWSAWVSSLKSILFRAVGRLLLLGNVFLLVQLVLIYACVLVTTKIVIFLLWF